MFSAKLIPTRLNLCEVEISLSRWKLEAERFEKKKKETIIIFVVVFSVGGDRTSALTVGLSAVQTNYLIFSSVLENWKKSRAGILTFFSLAPFGWFGKKITSVMDFESAANCRVRGFLTL